MPLHPATKILLWVSLAAVLPWLAPLQLLACSLALVVSLQLIGAAEFWKLLRRSRWLLLSLLLIYAFATPGNPLLSALGLFSPSREGLHSGALQAWRLTVLLSALALLLAATPRDQLLGGIYVLLRPLRPLHVNPEAVAARIWLTLHYAEQGAVHGQGPWHRRLQQALEPPAAAADKGRVVLQLEPFSWRDPAALLLALLLAGYLLR